MSRIAHERTFNDRMTIEPQYSPAMKKHDRASADDFEDATSPDSPTRHDHETLATTKTPAHNAFTEMMKPKPKTTKPTPPMRTDSATARTIYSGRDGLGAYIKDPASFPSSRVVYYNDDFVIINDLYPKASVHLLILPRDPIKAEMRPQNAFDDPNFLTLCRAEERKVRRIVADELRRKFGQFSNSDRERRLAMESDPLPQQLPAGRDWEHEIISGIHANPSMNHLHIHVLSRDMVSAPMRKANHYLSFTTDFLVNLDQFPLAQDDHRRDYRHFPEAMVCWRCGMNFGRKMAKLKEHLEVELDEWKQE